MTMIGCTRCSTDRQDLTAQRQALAAPGVPADRIYLDRGLTGTRRDRPGLDRALAAARDGDTLVRTKLDRLARLVPGPLEVPGRLSGRGAAAGLAPTAGDVLQPAGPVTSSNPAASRGGCR